MSDQLFQLVLALLGMSITGLAGVSVWILKDLSDNVKSLNVKMVIICERVESHEKRLDRIECPKSN